MSVVIEVDVSSLDTDLLACRGCLATDTELHDMNKNNFAQYFSDFIGLSVDQSDGYPQFVCSTCLFLLRKFVRFRRKCLTAMQTLQQMKLSGDIITTESIKSIDRTHIIHKYQKHNIFNINIIDRNNVDNFFDEIDKKLDEIIEIGKRHNAQTKTESVNKQDSAFVKQEHVDSDSSILNDNDDDIEDNKSLFSIKEEEKSKTPKKPIKRAMKDIKPKILKAKSKIKRKTTELAEDIDGEEELNEDWRTIIEEIKDEIATNIPTQRKVPPKAYVQGLLRKAKKFASTNNLELKFLTKEEQKIEIEEKRNSEKFKKAPYKCDKCCKVFNFEDTFANHSLLHSNGEFVCDICLYSFQTRLEYRIHFNKVHSMRMTCKECGLVNRYWNKARQHYLWHQGKNLNISCEQCGLQFALRKNYLNHVRNTHGGGVNGPQCLLCDRTFYNEKGLQMHLSKTHKDKPRCPLCDVVFASADALGVHVNAAQGCQSGRSCCPKCGDNFANESEMKTHFNEEHMKNYYKCEKCEKSFKDLTKYKRHVNNHLRSSSSVVGELADCPYRVKARGAKKAFICEVCGVEKGCMAFLKQHQRIHTGETPFQCHQCQKSFRLKLNLQQHIATHTGEKRYKCHLCPKTFIQMQHRTSHMVTHTKERPFACTACPKRYPYSASLREHVNTVHLGLPPRNRMKKGLA